MGMYGWNVDDTSFSSLAQDLHLASLLIEEVRSENLPEVRSLLEVSKANPNTVPPERGCAALHLLAGMEHEDFSAVVVLTVLLRCGGDPNVRSEEGLTPVHVAAMWGRCRVLELLLSNGGNPYLVDYERGLNAEDYALKENQWKAYGVITSFMVINEDEERFVKYLDEGSSNTEGTTNIGKPDLDKCNETKYTPVLPVNEEYDDDEDNDWLSKTKQTLALDEKSIKTIKNHRRRSKIYEYPIDVSRNKTEDTFKPKLPKRNASLKKHDESEMYFCSIDESSFKSRTCERSSNKLPGTSRTVTSADRTLNDRVLCKMSRIFLFILKKRHTYEQLK